MSAARTGDPQVAEMARAELARRAGSQGGPPERRGGDGEGAGRGAGASRRSRRRGGRADEGSRRARARSCRRRSVLPRPIKPAAELFGEILLELGRPREAAAAFEQALARWPNRSLALLGLARASAARGDRESARKHYRRLLANWSNADPGLSGAGRGPAALVARRASARRALRDTPACFGRARAAARSRRSGSCGRPAASATAASARWRSRAPIRRRRRRRRPACRERRDRGDRSARPRAPPDGRPRPGRGRRVGMGGEDPGDLAHRRRPVAPALRARPGSAPAPRRASPSSAARGRGCCGPRRCPARRGAPRGSAGSPRQPGPAIPRMLPRLLWAAARRGLMARARRYCAHRFVELPLLLHGASQVEVGDRQPGLEPHRLAEVAERLVRPSLLAQGHAQPVVELGVLRPGLRAPARSGRWLRPTGPARPGPSRDRRAPRPSRGRGRARAGSCRRLPSACPAWPARSPAASPPGRSPAGRPRRRRAGSPPRRAALLRERAAEQEPGLGRVRLERQGLAKVGDRPVEVAPLLQESGQLKVRALVLRPDGHRLPGRGQGRVEVAVGRGDLGHLQMAVGESRPLPEHLLAEGPGLGVLLVVHQLR